MSCLDKRGPAVAFDPFPEVSEQSQQEVFTTLYSGLELGCMNSRHATSTSVNSHSFPQEKIHQGADARVHQNPLVSDDGEGGHEDAATGVHQEDVVEGDARVGLVQRSDAE